MRRDRIGNAFNTRGLRLIGCLAALVMPSEAGAGALFSLPTSFPAGNSPRSVAVADLDGDTVPDLVTANAGYGSDNVSVLLGNGDGSFQVAVPFAAGDQPRFVAIADLPQALGPPVRSTDRRSARAVSTRTMSRL